MTTEGNVESGPNGGGSAASGRPRQVEKLLTGFPVVVDIPVAWGEMDANEHVNGAVFIRYFETSRFTYYGRLASFLEEDSALAAGRILASISCRYRAPLSFPDTVSVGTRVAAVGTERYVMEHRVVSHRLEQVAAEGESHIVCYDYPRAKKAALSDSDRSAIATLEGREPPTMGSR